MSVTTLKELLKPPFHRQDFSHFVYDGNAAAVLEINTILTARLFSLDVRNQAEKELLEYIAEALNEKWERDFGEPLRWESKGHYWHKCPKCGANYYIFKGIHNHCPSCGVRLLPLEETKDE